MLSVFSLLPVTSPLHQYKSFTIGPVMHGTTTMVEPWSRTSHGTTTCSKVGFVVEFLYW